METQQQTVKDKDLQYVIGNVLRWGVWSAMIIAFIGGVLYLTHHGQETVHYPRFTEHDQGIGTILRNVLGGIGSGEGQSLILLGIILLFATPIMRVIFSLIGFTLERDWLYVVITLIVLAIIYTSVRGGLG
jgi:uncharacterized membrane protein